MNSWKAISFIKLIELGNNSNTVD